MGTGKGCPNRGRNQGKGYHRQGRRGQWGPALVYSFSRCCALVMAASTDCRFTRDLMLDAVPYSLASMACVCAICKSSKAPQRSEAKQAPADRK